MRQLGRVLFSSVMHFIGELGPFQFPCIEGVFNFRRILFYCGTYLSDRNFGKLNIFLVFVIRSYVGIWLLWIQPLWFYLLPRLRLLELMMVNVSGTQTQAHINVLWNFKYGRHHLQYLHFALVIDCFELGSVHIFKLVLVYKRWLFVWGIFLGNYPLIV